MTDSLMTPAGNYAEAVRLVDNVQRGFYDHERVMELLAEAQVHAILAQTPFGNLPAAITGTAP